MSTPQDTGVNPLAVDPVTGASLPTAPVASPSQTSDSDEQPSVLNQPSASDNTVMGTMLTSSSMPLPPTPEPEPELAAPEPVTSEPAQLDLPRPVSTPVPAPSPAPTEASRDLLAIKQQALEQLDPLVSHLDQTPEEKFRTTMMLIQSTDNPSRLQDAYEAAQAISDEKVRAQALLDVINEINYFTQKSGN